MALQFRSIGAIALAGAVVLLGACNIEQTQEGELPDVDVDVDPGQLPRFEQTQEGRLPDVDIDVSGGRLPRYDVDGPDVDVGTEERTVDVPSGIDVETEQRTITTPDVDVELPDGNDADR